MRTIVQNSHCRRRVRLNEIPGHQNGDCNYELVYFDWPLLFARPGIFHSSRQDVTTASLKLTDSDPHAEYTYKVVIDQSVRSGPGDEAPITTNTVKPAS